MIYRVLVNNGILIVNGSTAAIIGAGTVRVTAIKAESNNYKEATATGNITIEKAPAPAIIYPTAAGSITYGQKLSNCALTGGSTEYGTFIWKDGSTVPAEAADTGAKGDRGDRIGGIAAGIAVIVLSLGIYFIVKRKKGEEV